MKDLMDLSNDLFAANPSRQIKVDWLAGTIPVILVDDVYVRPDDVRSAALQFAYEERTLHYPGKIAAAPTANRSLEALKLWVRELANSVYLSLAPITFGNRAISSFREVRTDFAVVDLHPDKLSSMQRMPHVDPVPLFGLIYLNRQERGGTLFFEPDQSREEHGRETGYFDADGAGFRLLGRIDPVFNRLAIYPGTVPHSGEIQGDWIHSEARFNSPRLTQRWLFTPEA